METKGILGIENNITEIKDQFKRIKKRKQIKKTAINVLISLAILAAFYLIVGGLIYYAGGLRPF